MIEEKKVIKKFKPFVLGFCKCTCNKEFNNIRNGMYLRRYFKAGHNRKGVKPHNFKGRIFKNNYWHLFKPEYFSSNSEGYIYEHIYIYQEHHKLCMLKWGNIHHIIPIKEGGTNDISNLQGMMKSQHTRLHKKGKKASQRCIG